MKSFQYKIIIIIIIRKSARHMQRDSKKSGGEKEMENHTITHSWVPTVSWSSQLPSRESFTDVRRLQYSNIEIVLF